MRLLRVIGTFLPMLLLLALGNANPTESDPGHVYSSGDWESLIATPGPIRSTAMAYSPDDRKILLYGGRDPQGLLLNDLWLYDTNTGKWTEKTNWTCSPCPSARGVHSIVYDDFNNVFVVFGGLLLSGHSFETNETWIYKLTTNTWRKLDFGTQSIPGPRHWGSIEYTQNIMYIYGKDPQADIGNFWRLTFVSNNISLNCFSKQPIQFGTDNGDQLYGNNARNVIYGLAGEDAIRGGKGGDFLCGEKGNDTIYGDGIDKLYGFSGNDQIHGGPGNDDLRGGSGTDILFGDVGSDSFDCGTGIDTISDFKPAEGDTKTADCENF